MVQAGESQVQVQVSAVKSAFQVCTYRLLYVQAVVTILYSNLLYVQEVVITSYPPEKIFNIFASENEVYTIY